MEQGSPIDVYGINVRPILPSERGKFDANLDEHHWLGHRLVGETMRYVALSSDGEWLALLGFGASALACRPRDRFIGWSDELHFKRLRYVTNNQRFCILPAGRYANVASAVLSRCLKRLSSDYEERWGHKVFVVETFVDPTLHRGTCYLASNFKVLGTTLGYGRVSGRYVHHGKQKLCLVRLLRRDALSILSSKFDHPAISSTQRRRLPLINLNNVNFEGDSGLLVRLSQIDDHRKARGVRHSLSSVLAVAACATISGCRSLTAIGEWAADCPQEVLARLGAKFHPVHKRYLAPSDATIRRAVAAVDADALDRVICEWLFDTVRAGHLEEHQLVVAVDGKSLRGATQDDRRCAHLFAAMVQGDRAVIAQSEVDHKTNEITAFKPLLKDLDLKGAVVTADAMHAQREHARFLCEDKDADYLLGVKGNQPSLLQAIESLPEGSFPP